MGISLLQYAAHKIGQSIKNKYISTFNKKNTATAMKTIRTIDSELPPQKNNDHIVG